MLYRCLYRENEKENVKKKKKKEKEKKFFQTRVSCLEAVKMISWFPSYLSMIPPLLSPSSRYDWTV